MARTSTSSSSRAVRQVKTVPVFLLVNPKSGGHRGSKLMRVPQPFDVEVSASCTASLRIYDMLEGPSGEKPGFVQLKEATRLGPVRMVVAGGDGTVLWALEEAEKHGVDTRHQVMLAVLPLGTGNDFSRFAGWGGKAPKMRNLTKGTLSGLRELVLEWVRAKANAHDIWRVAMEVDAHRGVILKTSHERKKVPINEKRIEKLMHSYFSAGNDARAGMGQEKVRTSTRWGNFLNYGYQICLKGLPFREKEYVKDFLYALRHGQSDESPVIFSTDDDEDVHEPRLVDNPQVLIILNIPNCYGGLCRFWEGAGSVGVHPVADANILHAELDPADGKLEVLTYGSLLMEPMLNVTTQAGLPAHRFNAKRIFSGAPLFLQLVEDDEEDVVVHVQVDGEFFKLKNPSSVSFDLHRQIKVLYGGKPTDADAGSDNAEEAESSSSESDEEGIGVQQ